MRPFRILIVDDHRETRRMLRAGLETLGHDLQIVDVPSGEEAILVNSRQPFDLLVADIRLPGISGLELIEHAQIRNPKLGIILVTGMTDSSVREKVRHARVEAYFYKPIEIDAFLAAVKKCLNIETKKGSNLSEKNAEGTPRSSSVGISMRLASLRSQMRADCAALVSERGELLAQAGVFPLELEGEPLVQSSLAALTALERISVNLGVASPESLSVINGEKFDVALRHVGQSIGLILVGGGGSFTVEKMELLAGEMTSAGADIFEILSKIGVPVEPVDSETSRKGILAEDEPDSEIPPSELESIFQMAQQPGEVDADAFWDTAVEEEQSGDALRSDTISYDQARQLGLAPDEP